MNQGNYSTADQTLAWPVLDLTNPQSPTYIPAGGQIKTLAPACYRITVKNTITITDATIVTCTSTTGGCTEPGGCPITVDPTLYYNLRATVNALVAQNNVIIEFDYLYNDTPVLSPTNQVTVNLAAGSNTVYLFGGLTPSNQALISDDTVSLYGARVISS